MSADIQTQILCVLEGLQVQAVIDYDADQSG
jgi:hypothetical protein